MKNPEESIKVNQVIYLLQIPCIRHTHTRERSFIANDHDDDDGEGGVGGGGGGGHYDRDDHTLQHCLMEVARQAGLGGVIKPLTSGAKCSLTQSDLRSEFATFFANFLKKFQSKRK